MKNKKEFNQINFIKKIISFSPRQVENETKTANFIKETLKENNIKYKEQKFKTTIPIIKKSVLLLDNKEIKSMGCSFLGGKIKGKENISSSLISSRFLANLSNITFNPLCKKEISCSNYYQSPSLAISRKDINRLLNSKKVEGEVIVKKTKHNSSNIIVGNIKNPKNIFFAHYDSVNSGAVDNASGVSVLMKAIIKYKEIVNNNLFVFSGNEELSYDKPTYWGRGYRSFEKKYLDLMKKSRKIIIIDSVGNGLTNIVKDPKLQYLAFPIENINKFKNKIFIVFGDFEKLMSVYHSNADDIKRSGIKEKYLEDCLEKTVFLAK